MAQQVWFTSDTHFGHANIVKYSGRPFADVYEMNEALILNWNAVVRPGDVVYHLGDFALCDVENASKIVKRLMGQKYLVFGNHDKVLRKDKDFLGHWIWGKDMADIKVGEQRIVLLHYAMRVWNQSHRGAWQLHGHSHGSLKEEPTCSRRTSAWTAGTNARCRSRSSPRRWRRRSTSRSTITVDATSDRFADVAQFGSGNAFRPHPVLVRVQSSVR